MLRCSVCLYYSLDFLVCLIMVICIASYCFVTANSWIRQTLIAIAVDCDYLTKEMQLFNTEFGVLNAEHGAFEHLYFNSLLCMVCVIKMRPLQTWHPWIQEIMKIRNNDIL